MEINFRPLDNTAAKEAGSGPGIFSKDMFLKILVAQMSHPDPFAPQDPGAFVTEMSQIAMMEQIMNLCTRMEEMYRIESLSRATELIGREVVVSDGNRVVTGQVEKVVFNGGSAAVVINGSPYDVGNLVEVR
ncbi:MAG: flagellar hook capping FlgD N-terminal domain-containing protein [Bacillota bacterium]